MTFARVFALGIAIIAGVLGVAAYAYVHRRDGSGDDGGLRELGLDSNVRGYSFELPDEVDAYYDAKEDAGEAWATEPAVERALFRRAAQAVKLATKVGRDYTTTARLYNLNASNKEEWRDVQAANEAMKHEIQQIQTEAELMRAGFGANIMPLASFELPKETEAYYSAKEAAGARFSSVPEVQRALMARASEVVRVATRVGREYTEAAKVWQADKSNTDQWRQISTANEAMKYEIAAIQFEAELMKKGFGQHIMPLAARHVQQTDSKAAEEAAANAARAAAEEAFREKERARVAKLKEDAAKAKEVKRAQKEVEAMALRERAAGAATNGTHKATGGGGGSGKGRGKGGGTGR